MKKRNPSRLFKYETLDDYSKMNLENNQVFFQTPNKFNDPFDCQVGMQFVYPTEKEYFNIFEKMKIEYAKDPSFAFTDCRDQRFRSRFLKEHTSKFKKSLIEIKKNMSVSCFTEINRIIPMWGYYADGHRGICLEFDGRNPFFDDLIKVHYTNKLETVNIYELKDDGFEINVKNALHKKCKQWKHEKEWRLIRYSSAHPELYPIDSLKAIYFGANSKLEDSIEIAKIANKMNPKIKLYKSKYNYKNYSVFYATTSLNEMEDY
jgi:hypothetical protein